MIKFKMSMLGVLLKYQPVYVVLMNLSSDVCLLGLIIVCCGITFTSMSNFLYSRASPAFYPFSVTETKSACIKVIRKF